MNYKICAIVVTYNRKELLVRNIESLLNQTTPLDIIIYDNASTDGTYEYLMEKGYIDMPNIIYVQSDKNRGGAGGFCNAEKEAVRRGYDLMWLMDDDGYCINENTLSELMKHYNPNEKKIINSYIICDADTKELTFKLGSYESDEEVQAAAENGVLFGCGNPYNGTLVPKKCFEEIGYTDEKLFIYGDERDFVIRSNAAGYEWITPIESLYFHPINRNIEKHTFFGFTYFVKAQPVWKFYIEYRNDVYLVLKYAECKKTRYLTNMRVKMILAALHSKDRKLKRIKWGWMAISDGIKESFDRPIPFKV